jgi:hypothetical protein
MQKVALLLAAALVSAACGSVKDRGLPDAPGSDSDAAVDAALTMVRATVLTFAGDGAPDLSAKVVFQDPEGAVVFDGPVGAMGHAQAELPRGGTVSAIRILADTPNGLSAAITTTTGVKPGDDLTFGLRPPGTIQNQGGQTTMTANFMPEPGASDYSVYTTCGSQFFVASATVPPITLTLRDSCHDQMFDLVIVASGAKLPTPKFLELTNVKYESGGTFNIPGSFTTMASYTINMTNIPDAVSNLNLVRTSMIDSVPAAPQIVQVGDPPAGVLASTVPFPQGFGTRSQIGILMSRTGTTVSQQYDLRTPTLGTSVTIDLGTQLPWITNPAATSTGATWTTVAPGDPPDGMLTQWSGQWNDGTRPVSVQWRVVQPAEATGMTLPHLPAAYATIDPGQQTVAVTAGSLSLAIGEYDNVAGYDELRQMPETLLTTSMAELGTFYAVPFQRRAIIFGRFVNTR